LLVKTDPGARVSRLFRSKFRHSKTAYGFAEREAAKVMISDAKQAAHHKAEITLGADKGSFYRVDYF